METKNLKELRAQEKATKARIIIVKPFAIEEAKILKPNGGKFTVEGVGDFILDKDPILDIETSRAHEAVQYRRLERKQLKLKDHSAHWDIDGNIFCVLTKLVLNTTLFTIITNKGFAMTEIE